MIPLSILLIPFAAFAAGVLGYGFLTMWAIYRFGGDFAGFVATFLFWAAAATVLFFTWTLLAGVDWTQPLLEFSAWSAGGL